MTGDAAITRALAELLEVDVDGSMLDGLAAFFEPALTEWSVNAGDDARGVLRYGSWTHEHERVRQAISAFGTADCLALHDAVPKQAFEGVGLAFSRGRQPRFRWWQLAPAAGGDELARAALGLFPELAPDCERLAAICGGLSRCCALGLERHHTRQHTDDIDGQAPGRTTIYFQLLGPHMAVELLEQLECPPSLRANLFFKALLGLEPGSRISWPKVWVGRSVVHGGAGTALGDAHVEGDRADLGGGWKFYYFARGDSQRRNDEVLLDLVDTSPALLAAWSLLRNRYPDPGSGAGLIQLLGLTFAEHALDTPRWTVYLARK